LRTPVRKHAGNGNFKLFAAEFAYNTSLNRTTDKMPHEIIYGEAAY